MAVDRRCTAAAGPFPPYREQPWPNYRKKGLQPSVDELKKVSTTRAKQSQLPQDRFLQDPHSPPAERAGDSHMLGLAGEMKMSRALVGLVLPPASSGRHSPASRTITCQPT